MRTVLILTSILFLGLIFPKSILAANIRVPILMYHYVDYNPNPKDIARDALSVTPDKFEVQMDYLAKNGYTPITLDTLYGIYNNQTTVSGKPVVITFDDGYENFYRVAFPILRKHNFKSVVFIPTGLVGTGYYMNWNQIKEIQSSGLVNFESHAVSHGNLASMRYEKVYKELVDSKNILQSQTGYPVNFVAYPYGASNSSVISAAQKAGYAGGVGTWYGKASGFGMNLPRFRISGGFSLKDFAARL